MGTKDWAIFRARKALSRKIRGKLRKKIKKTSKADIVGYYSFLQQRPVGDAHAAIPPRSINWVIPMYGRGSGGHLNIIRFAYFLESMGFDCRIIVAEPYSARLTRAIAAEEIRSWYFPLKGPVYLGIENAPPAEITMATGWQTAYPVRNFQATRHKCYFVQDFEPWFYPAGSEAAFAEETYRFGFRGITAGSWLADKLRSEYGMTTSAVGFSYDHDRYKPAPKRLPHIRRVLFYARPPTPRRAFEMGVLVLQEVVNRLPDIEVVFAGWDVSAYEIRFKHLNLGLVPLDELPDLYTQCDVALVLSFSNASLLPLELMACGTPVVSNRGPFTEWLLNDRNACLAPPTVEDLATAVCEVLENPKEQERLRQGGLEAAAQTSWLSEVERMATILSFLTRRVAA